MSEWERILTEDIEEWRLNSSASRGRLSKGDCTDHERTQEYKKVLDFCPWCGKKLETQLQYEERVGEITFFCRQECPFQGYSFLFEVRNPGLRTSDMNPEDYPVLLEEAQIERTRAPHRENKRGTTMTTADLLDATYEALEKPRIGCTEEDSTITIPRWLISRTVGKRGVCESYERVDFVPKGSEAPAPELDGMTVYQAAAWLEGADGNKAVSVIQHGGRIRKGVIFSYKETTDHDAST